MRFFRLGLLGSMLVTAGILGTGTALASTDDCYPYNSLLAIQLGSCCDPILNVTVGERQHWWATERDRARFTAVEARRVYAADQAAGADPSVLTADQIRIDQADQHLAALEAQPLAASN